ncbi:MAG: formate/nitrite transporter family protein [Halosimplex sp.]
MAQQLDPSEIFDRAVEEGKRRLDQSLLELTSTSVIAGFTIVFGHVALGIVEAFSEPVLGDLSEVGGALAFAIGMVFLVAGRTELFNENFSDPTAAAVVRPGFSAVPSLVRLWVVTLAFNLVAGSLFALLFAVDGVIPHAATVALEQTAVEIAGRTTVAWFVRAVAGGTLVSLLSFLIVAVRSEGSRLALTFAVGFLLALGPFEHVVVSALHVVIGAFLGAPVGVDELVAMTAVVTAGNFVGGLGLVTLTHVTQAIGADRSGA